MDLGGAPEDYDIGGERVFAKSDAGKGLTYAQAAQRAIELGGKFDGHEVAQDLNVMTKASAAGVAGTGLVGGEGQPAAHGHGAGARGGLHRDRARRRDRQVRDSGVRRRRRLRHGAAPAGSVPPDQERSRHGLRPRGQRAAHLRPAERPARQHRPAAVEAASYLDVPATMQTAWTTSRTRRTPSARRASASRCRAARRRAALRDLDALGGHYFNRVPVMADMIVNAAAKREQSHKPLQVNTA